jgi:fatty acid desaturase
MRLFRHSGLDGVLLMLTLGQLSMVAVAAWAWPHLSAPARLAAGLTLVAGHWYAIVVIGHIFVHAPWFSAPAANRAAGLLVSLAIGQSVAAYRLSHLRNHHRFNNDRQDAERKTRDTSSTFRHAAPGRHLPLWRYALVGALGTIAGELAHRVTVLRLWFGGPLESGLETLLAARPNLRAREIVAVRLERTVLSIAWLAVLAMRPTFLAVYVAALTAAFALVNLQNYFEHYGADPDDPLANSVSHYGRLYNLLAFNDGYHQEHHLRPGCHWRALPTLRARQAPRLGARNRVVSPVPAVLGFLHLRRPRLDLPAERGA